MATFAERQPFIDTVRTILELDREPWIYLPDGLLFLALISPGYPLPPELKTYLEEQYGVSNYDVFEFFGDGLIDAVFSDRLMVFWREFTRPNVRGYRKKGKVSLVDKFSLFTHRIRANIFFYCLMDKLDLCHAILGWQEPTEDPDVKPSPFKICADSFEAIVGVLYYWLRYIYRAPNPFTLLRDWVVRVFDLDLYIRNYIETNSLQCQPRPRWGDWLCSERFRDQRVCMRQCKNPRNPDRECAGEGLIREKFDS